MGREVTSTLRVRYAETDAQGRAYHGWFLAYFEVARGDFLRRVGFDYNAMEREGAFVVVVEAHLRYHAPARYDDELTIATRLSELKTRSFRFEYEVRKGDTLVASGWTAHVVVNREGKPVELPRSLRSSIEEGGLAPEAPFLGDAVISPEA